ncbi:hypothetical protein SDC9_170311 [bioreactor metagenome]|uniref:Uncharacterized protein n=1 Tax=bioreactor metagenome TaxID=1076179 RepID=A0A645G9X1_9ZZZZ
MNDIINFENTIKESLPFSITDTLATKIMMVVFGCVPAYDRNFSATLKPMSFGKDSLEYIYKFYQKNNGLLDEKQKELKTVSVEGGLTDYTYTMAKIIDVIGFHVKEELNIKEEKQKDLGKWEEKEKKREAKEQRLINWLKGLKPELKDC